MYLMKMSLKKTEQHRYDKTKPTKRKYKLKRPPPPPTSSSSIPSHWFKGMCVLLAFKRSEPLRYKIFKLDTRYYDKITVTHCNPKGKKRFGHNSDNFLPSQFTG